MRLIRDILIVLGIEVVRFVADLILFFFWLPWHWWRTRQRRNWSRP